MPYGLPKAKGGDTKASDAWMERCITDVMSGGKSKLSAILICKTAFAKRKKG